MVFNEWWGRIKTVSFFVTSTLFKGDGNIVRGKHFYSKLTKKTIKLKINFIDTRSKIRGDK